MKAKLKWRAGYVQGPKNAVTYETNIYSDGTVELMLIDDYQAGWKRIRFDDLEAYLELLKQLKGNARKRKRKLK